ncbi:MAG: demethylmenaquinone methyltransferase [Acidobacteria bacterium]|nr:MAG: demethylmenaquinone methyltransferase [Acidobacteriota bacterium]
MFECDSELFTFVKTKLYVAVVCDILDEFGFRHQAMHQRLRPLLPDPKRCGFVGRARTARWMETDYVVEDPYGLEIEMMDSLKPGDVVVHSTDHAGSNAPWGELMSTVAQRNGAVGCVCDSQIRDCIKIVDLGFPVYYAGIRPLDSKGRGIVAAYDVPVRCGDVLVKPGELIFADFDGIVVVPHEVEGKVLHRALEKVEKENLSHQELSKGKSLRDVYNKYGVL